MPEFQKGDRVKVEYEGTVLGRGVNYEDVYVKPPTGPFQYVNQDHVTLVEPEYVDGAFYRDAHGAVWQYSKYNGSRPWSTLGTFGGSGHPASIDVPVRPLVRLVPEK